jgi:N-acetylglucosaminyldiphosphoundecaprenol N-acetyl-beta-D-mannosaminyltransferase
MSETFATRQVAGIPIVMTNSTDAAIWICGEAQSKRGAGIDVHLANAYTVALAESDASFRESLVGGVVFPDGKPLAWLTRFSRRPLGQVRGPGLFGDVLSLGREHGLKHFLLGTTDATLELLQKQIESRFPGVQIAGKFSPPFRELTAAELEEQDNLIKSSGADVVWVGLGTPKQDHEVRRLAKALPIVAIAVGAAFDFYAGTKKEAPKWMTDSGTEWIFRFGSEPRRLWKRYLLGNVIFLFAVGRPRRESTGAFRPIKRERV